MLKNKQVKGYFFCFGCRRRAAFLFASDQNAVTVVDLMLNDLGGPAGEGL